MNFPSPVPDDELPEPTPGSWLTGARIAVIAERCAEWLIEPTSWIDRRKDSVKVIDDHSVRWQTSVDFGCRRDSDGIEHACDEEKAVKPPDKQPSAAEVGTDAIEQLYCAPLFVRPKQPSGYMAFDLTDETGRSLSLPGRADNMLVTAEILVEMARRMLKNPDPAEFKQVATEIRVIATGAPREAKLRARRRLKPRADDDAQALWTSLAAHERFAWWLRTAAETSIVVVLFRSHPAARKRIKLSYQAAILTTTRSWRHRLGWEPYSILLDVPWIEARGYHLEAAAPPGMRIEHAWLAVDENDVVVEGGDPLTRQVHLRRAAAMSAGAGAGRLTLRVAGDGFLTGAWLAGLFVVAALLACAIEAPSIARNPATAPALLLLLPGLLTSLVGRPDRHALTTRLLSRVRILLISCGVLAYAAAAVVALAGASTDDKTTITHRSEHLHALLWPLFGAATMLWLLLSVAFVRSRPRLRRLFRFSAWGEQWRSWTRRSFKLEEVVLLSPEECLDRLYAKDPDAPIPSREHDKHVSHEEIVDRLGTGEDSLVHGIMRRRWWSTWTLLFSAAEDQHGTRVGVTAFYELPRLLAAFRGRRVDALEQTLLRRLDDLAEQSATLERPTLAEGAQP